jgi:hypothetical protein
MEFQTLRSLVPGSKKGGAGGTGVKKAPAGETYRATRPQQILLFALLINATGSGLYVASAPIYLIRYAELSEYEAGLGFTIGSAIALVMMAHFGYLCDRMGAKLLYIVSCVAYAGAMVAFAQVRDMVTFTVVAPAPRPGRVLSRGPRWCVRCRTATCDGSGREIGW